MDKIAIPNCVHSEMVNCDSDQGRSVFGNRRRNCATARIAKTREHRSGPQDAMYVWILILVIVCAVSPAIARTHTVKKDHSGDFATIQDCADAVERGSTCEVYSGTYNESVTVPINGAPGNWITFRAAEGHSPEMTGGWNIEGRNNIIIEGFTCGGIHSRTYSGEPVNHIQILNNLIQNTGIGISLKGDDVLISGNTFNNMGNDMVRQFGDRWTIRNNVVMAETDSNDEHMDFWQSWCNPSGMAAAYYLIENNTFINITGGNVHFALINGTAKCNDPTTNSIVRYNKVYQIGSMGLYIDANKSSSGSKDNVIYNNTWIGLSEGSFASWQNHAHNYTASADSTGINNLFFDAMYHSKARGFAWKIGGAQSHNLYYDSDHTMTFSGLAAGETGAVKNKDPLIKDPGNNDFSLDENSRAINAGGPLTYVATGDSGAGYSLILDKAEFFQPGWGGADPDTIAIGSTGNISQIVSIDYAANTIVLDSPISRSVGDPVYLYRDSDGTRVFYGAAPDIGAVEHMEDDDIQTPSAPENLIILGH